MLHPLPPFYLDKCMLLLSNSCLKQSFERWLKFTRVSTQFSADVMLTIFRTKNGKEKERRDKACKSKGKEEEWERLRSTLDLSIMIKRSNLFSQAKLFERKEFGNSHFFSVL